MDDLRKAKRRWKRAEDALEEAQSRLKSLTGKPGGSTAARELAQARKEVDDAKYDERKAKRKYRKLKAADKGT